MIDPKECLSCLMSQLTHAMEQAMSSTLAEINLTLLQLAALAELDANESLSTADLARLTSVTPQNMSLTISKLEQGGELVRMPHATNARVNQLKLTAKGRRVLRQGMARAMRIEDQAFAALAQRERVSLTALLRNCLWRVKQPHAKKVAKSRRVARQRSARRAA